MTHALHVWADNIPVAVIEHEGRDDQWGLRYAPPWLADAQAFPLSPALPLRHAVHASATIKRFIEHLLPEGRALDVVVAYKGLTKTNVFGLIWALGAETAGALRFTGDAATAATDATTKASTPREIPLSELDDRIAQRDEAALKALYDLTSRKLYGLSLRVVRSSERAEDVLQESFMQVWRNAADYRASLSPPMAWLGMIVRSRSLDCLRRRAAERSHLTDELDDTLADTLQGDSPDPLDTSLASQQAWALHQCLGKLEHKQREVVSLAYLRDLSHSELSQQLQLPLGTVKTWIRRGLDQLRACMARFA